MNPFSFFERLFFNIENSEERKTKLHSDVESWLQNYFNENHAVEKMCVSYFESRNEEDSQKIRNLRNEIYVKYWRSNTEYYKPSGLSSSINHDWEKVENLDVIQNNDSENRYAVVNYSYEKRNYSFLIKFVGPHIFIEHKFF